MPYTWPTSEACSARGPIGVGEPRGPLHRRIFWFGWLSFMGGWVAAGLLEHVRASLAIHLLALVVVTLVIASLADRHSA